MAKDDKIEIAAEKLFHRLSSGGGGSQDVTGFFEYAVAREEKWTVTPGGQDRVARHGPLVEQLVDEVNRSASSLGYNKL